MRIAETVTFGGSGLDRSAELRGKPEEIARLMELPDARSAPLWRGKPLFADEDLSEPGWLELGHPALADAAETPIFLGLDGDAPRFSCDVSGWRPEEIPDSVGAFVDTSRQFHPALPDGPRFAELRGAMTRLTPRAAELLAMARALTGWHRDHRYCARCGEPSVMAQAGWQRDCPACDAQHFPRTDPVAIMLITRGNSALLGRSHGWPEGMYSLLAGFVEPGETIEAAVRREVLEEAGIRVGRVEYLASQPWPFPSSLMFGCRGEALDGEIAIDPGEIDDAIWVTREEMLAVFSGENARLKEPRRGAIAHFIIWNWLADRLD